MNHATSVSNSPKPRRWVFRPGAKRGGVSTEHAAASDAGERAAILVRAVGCHPVVARILTSRGIDAPDTASAFLNPRLSSLLDPFLLDGMEAAASHIVRAVRAGKRICVFGDYDVDGLTATAVLLVALRSIGGDVFPHIPHRLREGYGLHRDAIAQVAEQGARLIVTVDNGITAVEEIAHARALGIEVVVTDHHQPGPELPEAQAIVNPNLPEALYPHGCLSGVGVAFKLAHAVLKMAGVETETGKAVLGNLLEFVALGTLADVVSLEGENRILVRWGLQRLARSNHPGLRALLELTGRFGQLPTAYTVNFVLAPRLNAAGRTGDADIALRLLLAEDPHQAAELARDLDRLNDERRGLERGILNDSVELLEERGDLDRDCVLVAESEGWHLGVLGIVAARIAERYSRPVVVLAVHREIAKGSARSVLGYNIHAGLTACEPLLLSYGGHAAAAGLRLRVEAVAQFREAINDHARSQIGDTPEAPPLEIDATVAPEEIDFRLIDALHHLEPFGQGNPEPVLMLRGVRLAAAPRIVGNGHLRLEVKTDGRTFKAIGFNLAAHARTCEAADGTLDLAFLPRRNEWRGDHSLELLLRDLRPAATT